MTTRSRIVLAVHRALLRTSRSPLRHLWALAYRAIGLLGAVYLARGQRGASAYLRASFADGEFLPGLSDVDVVLVLPDGRGVSRARASARWERLRRGFPLTALVLDHPRIYEEGELRELVGATSFTYGLDAPGEPRAGYFGHGRGDDRIRMLERPGRNGAIASWHRLSGPDRRPADPAWDPQLRRLAAWLELVYWWHWVFPVCIDPTGPRTAHLCVKLVAEPARVWLWLAHGEQASGREDALLRARRRLPEEEVALGRALDLHRSLPASPPAPLDEVLPVLVRLSSRIADVIERQIAQDGVTEVRLAGGDPGELRLFDGGWQPDEALVGGRQPSLLALCDWRSVVCGERPDEALASLPGDPRDPEVLGAAAAGHDSGPYPAFRADGLLILAGVRRLRTRLRAVKSAVSDPVSFGLAEGAGVARFPAVRGWSARDTARRAVAEQRAWLRTEAAAVGTSGLALAKLLASARAALFLETVQEGEPELAVTVTETARRLAARASTGRGIAEAALEGHREFTARGLRPEEKTVLAVRDLVLGLPAYRA